MAAGATGSGANAPVNYGQTVVFPGGPGYNDGQSTALKLQTTAVVQGASHSFTVYTFATATVATVSSLSPKVETGVMSLAYTGPIDVYQERQGVLAVIIEYTRLSRFLSQLEVGRTGTAFILDSSGELIAAPDKDADELHPAHSRIDMLPLARMAMNEAGDEGRNEASRHRLSLDGATYEVALTPLPVFRLVARDHHPRGRIPWTG